MNNNLSGLEFLSCIPGTIGGGIKMNAGCFGREFKDILISIQAIDKMGNVTTIPSKNIKFGYRKNNLSDDLIFLSASFKGIKGNRNAIIEKMNKLKVEKDRINLQKSKQVEVLLKTQYLKQIKKSGSL